jgi:ribosome-associated toxin RatA of RatAB toxin-antitoxin module
MTEMRSAIEIAAPAEHIYRLAADTERWPVILPHYRSVRVLARNGATRTVAMKAWRDAVPISWIAEQTDEPETPAIRFRHVAGWTRGMDVVWHFAPAALGTLVTIEHRLQFAFPFASEWLGKHVVGGFFVDDVARKTLARMKLLAESVA